jgi:hypothetical protein
VLSRMSAQPEIPHLVHRKFNVAAKSDGSAPDVVLCRPLRLNLWKPGGPPTCVVYRKAYSYYPAGDVP